MDISVIPRWLVYHLLRKHFDQMVPPTLARCRQMMPTSSMDTVLRGCEKMRVENLVPYITCHHHGGEWWVDMRVG